MRHLAHNIENYVAQHFNAALSRDAAATVRPILVGPPDAALSELFSVLTNNCQRDWQISVNGTVHDVVVLYVGGPATAPCAAISCACHWDFAVTIRNSRRLVLILTSGDAWDNRPESLANTTETLGSVTAVSHDRGDSLQRFLRSATASHLGIQISQAKQLIDIAREESHDFETVARETMSWEVLDNLFALQVGASPNDDACRAAGLPIVAGSQRSFRDSFDILRSLANFVGNEGLHDAIDQMKTSNAAQTRNLSASLDQLETQLSSRLFSPTEFPSAPTQYFRAVVPVQPWHDALTAEALNEILDELNQSPPQDRLALACTNALLGGRPLKRGPFLVRSAPALHASSASGTQPLAVTFTRKVDRAQRVQLSPTVANPLDCVDTTTPSHRKPLKYTVTAAGCRPGAIDILALDTFECGGLIIARDAERNGIPTYATRPATWSQEIVLSRGGTTELQVFFGPNASSITLARDAGLIETQQVPTGIDHVVFLEDIEDSDAFHVTLADANNAQLGTWTLKFFVRDVTDVSNSRLEALIWEHRTRRSSTPHAPDTPIHRLELGSYLPSSESWKPVIACWSGRTPVTLSIDFAGDRFVGDVRPQIEPRPNVAPPAALLASREAVRVLLAAENRCISEIELDNPSLREPVEVYLREYLNWFHQAPAEASWFDAMVLYTAKWNPQAGENGTSEEPAVLMLSPLHPLRLAWHVVAQSQLTDSIDNLCPAAGLLNPSQCPDAAVLYLNDGQSVRSRAFFSLPCDHAHWATLINTAVLDHPDQKSAAMQSLTQLGLMVQAITGGFTAQQTQDSLREVNRLLPARATLRVGIVGDADSSSECGDGVFEWSEAEHAEGDANCTGCLQVEVYDTRGANDPSPEQLADLSETTAERVRWFKLGPNATVPYLDLTIIDQLGASTNDTRGGDTRSVTAPAGLFRVRIREDFSNARTIVESRVSATRLATTSLEGLVCNAISAFESSCAQIPNATHFHFTPNQQAVGTRLQNAIFLSVTSSQIDPACIVRGAINQGGYLWDYELPSVLGGGESSLGYYLVARPTSAMRNSVERAAEIVANPPPNVDGLLNEISCHGIPILKRLASGGSQSRGELGLLLATRLIQDVFRTNASPARLPVWAGRCVHLVLPVDPYEELFDRLRKSRMPANTTAQRPDLVVIALRLGDADAPISIKLTPVEVKYRAGGMAATDMRTALGQASNLGQLFDTLWVQPPTTDLWQSCSSALLAQFLDFGFRIYAGSYLHNHDPSEWSALHQRVMQDVLERCAQVTVNKAGRLLVFGGPTTSVADLDGDNRQDTITLSLNDSRALLMDGTPLSPIAESSISQLDFSYPDCGATMTVPATLQPPSPAAPTPPLAPQAQRPAETVAQVPPETAPGAQQPNPTSPETPPLQFATPVTPVVESSPLTQEPAIAARRPAASRVPPEIRQRVREAFDGFIGNDAVVTRLTNDLLRALIDQPPHLAKNYLYSGLPSTGKTELARRMAVALALPFVKLDGRGVTNRDRLFELVKGELQTNGLAASQVGQQLGLPVLEYPPLVIFIDEVHLVPRGLQEALLTMLEAADRTVVLSDHVAHVQRTTFLFATTRVSDVDPAFASRCDEILLREYDEAQVAQILRWKVPHDDWPDAIYERVARLGRCVPRVAIQLAEALETAELVAEEDKPIDAHLEDVRRAREIDDRGLTRMDFEYLDILERATGPVGEQALLNLMRTVDKDRVLNEVEPFLVRLNYIQRGPRGRELTTDGREYLLAHRLRGQTDQ
jgi:DNA phosphorothioation-dependent restriction protein DptH